MPRGGQVLPRLSLLLLLALPACQQIPGRSAQPPSVGPAHRVALPATTGQRPADSASVPTLPGESPPIAPPLETSSPPVTPVSSGLTDPLKNDEASNRSTVLIWEGSPQAADMPQPPGPNRPPPRPLALALDAFLAHRPEEALRHLQIYTPKDQEIVMRLLPLLSAIDQGGLLTAHPKAAQLEQFLALLEEVEGELRPAAPLVLERLAFCHEIKSFGRYNAVKSSYFQPGESKWLYAEVKHLLDRRLKDGSYSVRLKGMIELFSADGKPVGPVEMMHSDANNSASPRNDYFVRLDFRVPPQLAPGQYLVRIRIDDLDTGRSAQASLPFQVVAKR